MDVLCYPEAVTHPKDFSTIGLELNFSDPTKSDPNLENLRYQATDQFIVDIRPVFNCIKSNGPDHAISQMGMRAEFNNLPHYLKKLNPPLFCPPCPHSHYHHPRQTTRTSSSVNVNSHHQKERFHFCRWWSTEGCEGQPKRGTTEVLQQVIERTPS